MEARQEVVRGDDEDDEEEEKRDGKVPGGITREICIILQSVLPFLCYDMIR